MRRRAFISGLAKAFAAASVAANLVREETLMPLQRSVFRPADYVGDSKWINIAVKDVWVQRYRLAYEELAKSKLSQQA